MRAHPFFKSVEWELLAGRALPAPFKPDAHLVYAKDYVPPLSVTGGGKKKSSGKAGDADAMPTADVLATLGDGWSYTCSEHRGPHCDLLFRAVLTRGVGEFPALHGGVGKSVVSVHSAITHM